MAIKRDNFPITSVIIIKTTITDNRIALNDLGICQSSRFFEKNDLHIARKTKNVLYDSVDIM